jgi:phosphoglycerate dehydrogenase-like enzyme
MTPLRHIVAAALLASLGVPGGAQDIVTELGLRAAPAPVRTDPRWAPGGPIVVRVLAAQQLASLQQAAGDVRLIGVANEAEALAAIDDATALLGFCSAELLDAAPRLRWVQLYSAGVEKCVGLTQIRTGAILLTNGQRVSSPTIAEHTLGMMLTLTRGLAPHISAQSRAEWNPELVPRQNRLEINGRTMLVVGLGGIGTEVARRAHALGMQVIALTSATRGLFDAEFFRAMSPQAFFINVGRGQSVVTDDLVAALRSGHIAGAGLDVTDPEPLPPDHPLWRLPNVVITPHVSAQSDRIVERVVAVARENLRRYVAGEPMLSVVDPKRGY